MSEILVQGITEDDKPTKGVTREEMWRDGAWHRITRVMLRVPDGQFLIQKRVDHAQLFPGRWDCSAAGHVDEGEEYEQAANREVEEEIGLTGIALREVAYYKSQGEFEGRKLNRWTKVYEGQIDGLPSKLQTLEVAAVKLISEADLLRLVEDHPELVTDGLVQYFEQR